MIDLLQKIGNSVPVLFLSFVGMTDTASVLRVTTVERFPTTALCRARCRTCCRYEVPTVHQSSFHSARCFVSCCVLCLQPHHRALDDIGPPSVHTHNDDIHSIIHRIKSAEIIHRLHSKFSERVRTERETLRGHLGLVLTCMCVNPSSPSRVCPQPQEPAPVETLERPLPLQQQQQTRIKRQLVNVYVSFSFTPFSPVKVTDRIRLTLLSALRSFLIKGGAGCDGVFIGISGAQAIGDSIIICVLGSAWHKCSFSAPW